MSDKRSKQVYCYQVVSNGTAVYVERTFPSITSAANYFNINRSTLSYNLGKEGYMLETTDEATGVKSMYVLTFNYLNAELPKIPVNSVQGNYKPEELKHVQDRPVTKTITFWRKVLNFFGIKW